jgi:hypothetical protein
MTEASKKLLSLVEAAEPRLREISESESIQPILPGGWSRKQIIGHLIDSASINHQRFVRAALQTSLDFPGYDQPICQTPNSKRFAVSAQGTPSLSVF